MPNPTTKSIVLASASAQRKALLQQMGFDPICVTSDIDETRHANESALAYVQRLAREKCQFVMDQYPDAVVVGADTVISVDRQIIGKAADLDAAIATLTLLSDRQHSVLTGVALDDGAQLRECVCETRVVFRSLTRDEMVAYWNSGEPQGKAGCYAIQGKGAIFVKSLSGSYSNVVGLPVFELAQQLSHFGISVNDCPGAPDKYTEDKNAD